MRTVEFGEIKTSVLGFGCGSVMGRVGRRDSLRAMHAAWDAGITLFDTARSYGYGEAESLLGEFLGGRRTQATVVTKFGILPATPARWKRLAKPLVRGGLAVLPQARAFVRRGIASELSAGHFDVTTLRRSLDESLRQLHTDYVDILLAHEAPASVMAQDDLIAELDSIIRAGKARRFGLACSLQTAQQCLQQTPAQLGAVQFSALFSAREGVLVIPAQANLFAMANHPFGGGRRAAQLQAAMLRCPQDPALPASLREKLAGDARTSAARFSFSDLLHAGVHAIVPSMLQLQNIRANVTAIEAETLSMEECNLLQQRLSL